MSVVEQPISVQCGQCSHGFRVKAKGAGKTISCPSCRKPVQVPWPDPPSNLPQNVSAAPAFDPDPQTPINMQPVVKVATLDVRLPRTRSYPVLGLLSVLLRAAAYLIGALSVIGFAIGIIVALRAGGGSQAAAVTAWVITSGPMLIGAIIVAMLLVMSSELIKLAMDIQENTLATAHAARQTR